MKLSKSRMIFGGLVLAGIVFGFSLWVNSIRRDLSFVKDAKPLVAQDIATLREDQAVFFTGVIVNKNPRFYKDLVVGVEEWYYSGEDGGWEVERDPEVRFQLQIDSGREISLFIDSPYPHGNYKTYPAGNRRWRGYPADSLLSGIATVSREKPLLLEVVKHFSGTQTHYLKDLKRSLRTSRIIAGILILIIALIMFWPEKKK